jgi:hypothetical protein
MKGKVKEEKGRKGREGRKEGNHSPYLGVEKPTKNELGAYMIILLFCPFFS